MRPICLGLVNRQLVLRPLRAIVAMTTLATELLTTWNAAAGQRDAALDAAIPAAMRSGLYNYADDTNQELPQQPFRQWAPRELLEVAYRHPLRFPPGRAFDYSNTNTVLLGMVVEKVSGQSLASFIEQNILQPVGMTRTVFPAGAEMPSP